MRWGARWGGLAAAALVAVAAGCGGSGGDKAGGTSKEHPLVLTLESEDDVVLSGAPEFAEAVARLSQGSLRIDLVPAGRSTEVDFERGVLEDVRDGKAQLGIVGARVWDTLGVGSFEVLLAPFLVDSYELERRVLESTLAEEMLVGVEQAGVVGIALLPGPLRRPFGITRALLGSDAYRGATIGLRPAALAGETLRALGSRPRAYVPGGDLAGLDGAELDPTTIAFNDYDRQALTTNVVLWPKPFTIVMNRTAFEALTGEQQEVLRRAGREAIAPELEQIERDEARAVGELCTQLSFVTATARDRAALRAAVQPVYAALEGNARVGRQLAEIEATKRETAPTVLAVLDCPRATAGAATGVSALEGTWETTWIRAALIAEGIAPRDATALSGHHTVEFANGRVRFQGDPGSGKSAVGTYTVRGDVIRFVFDTGIALQLGRPYELRWSIYREVLTFSAAAGSEPLLAFLTAPYTRVR